MTSKRAIEIFKDNIYKSCYEMKHFTLIGCNSFGEKNRCGCISGVEWDNIIFKEYGLLMPNGYFFKYSIDQGNELYNMILPLFQPTKLNQTMNNRNYSTKKL